MQNLLKQETISSSNSYSMHVYLKEKKKKAQTKAPHGQWLSGLPV